MMYFKENDLIYKREDFGSYTMDSIVCGIYDMGVVLNKTSLINNTPNEIAVTCKIKSVSISEDGKELLYNDLEIANGVVDLLVYDSHVTSCNANETATITITPDEVHVIALAVLFKSEAIELQALVDLPVVTVPHS